MDNADTRSSWWRAAAITAGFWVYAILLLLGARWAAHQLPVPSLVMKLSTMTLVALGLAPWSRWLQPRLIAVMGIVGRLAFIVCYFTLVVPFAVVIRMAGDPLRTRRPPQGSWWRDRPARTPTIEAARVEY